MDEQLDRIRQAYDRTNDSMVMIKYFVRSMKQ
jgi:hypothetical protein